ncbi:MAG: alpha/beta fold hydrolase [Ignavibacteriae bacterium]|nr:alpha/beta fold hydrolase [Ignavibacteriota bacterium]
MVANQIKDVIAYETFGNPSHLPIVFIHGFPFSKEMWKPQIEALKEKYFLISYDVRGHGKSEVGDGQYTIELFVDDLIDLLDALKLRQIVLVGLSMGGYIALRTIERHPERICALVLCDTKSEADTNENKIKRASQIKIIKAKGLKTFSEGFLKAVFDEQTFSTNPEAINLIRKIINTNPPNGVCGTLIALAARTDTTESLPKIHVPTLILVGEHDALTLPSSAQAMKEKIPNSELHIIPNAAHMSNLENPELFNQYLTSFLTKLL